ncbi:phospholipase A2-like [Coccinella septempunctata]|uniref:phospholipase A2-like n=1 Tax=Coccinella septempunctata TaxID=41139 RepID=UPI001D063970|nr:phospholipase A2-like [Coccinella septempunctata]
MRLVIIMLCATLVVAHSVINSLEQKFEGQAMDELREDRIHIIFPGTKWCGSGNISKSEEDLGVFKKTDACCRTHDNCPDIMAGRETKYNLTNPSFFTRLSCDCDTKFYNCLKEADSAISQEIGFIYFNLLSTQCYKREFPIKRCLKHIYVPRRKCKEYELDESKGKVYQFFDVPKF